MIWLSPHRWCVYIPCPASNVGTLVWNKDSISHLPTGGWPLLDNWLLCHYFSYLGNNYQQCWRGEFVSLSLKRFVFMRHCDVSGYSVEVGLVRWANFYRPWAISHCCWHEWQSVDSWNWGGWCVVLCTMYMSDSLVAIIYYTAVCIFSGESFERSYLGNLSAIQLNGYYAAALFEGKIELHIVCTIVSLLH